MLNRNLMRLSVLLSVVTMSAWSCEKSDSNGPRKEYIEVYLSKDAEEPVTSLSVPCAGGEFKLYVKTDVDFKPDWQDEIASPWVKVANVEKDGDWSVINLNIQPISEKCYYTRRTGTLMLKVPEMDFGSFITVNQGLIARLSANFSWMKYGSANPLSQVGEVHISKWTGTSQKWESTVYEEGVQPACFGKYGWFYIGDESGHKADIMTPFMNGIQADSLLMVSFKAVAYTSEAGVKDAAKLRFEVLGGGVIQDFVEEGRTSMDIDLQNFSVEDPTTISTTMWDNEVCAYNIFLIATEKSPFTGNTRLRFTTLDGEGKPNRVAMDNIYVRKYVINKDVQDEDVFAANGGSGKDRITVK
ncbi:MAG: hypothetical protein LKJ87_08605 [Bacteroidales bacterium]|nr:hypothetical protein [Bacteroidales bacterium]